VNDVENEAASINTETNLKREREHGHDDMTFSGADSIGHGRARAVPPLLQMAGHGVHRE